MIEVYANTPLNYTYNIALDNTLLWNAQTAVVTLDYDFILDTANSNNNLSYINSIITDTNPNLPNPNNFALTISANSYQTQQYMASSFLENEKIMLIQTIFTSNSGVVLHANNIALRVKNSVL
jgi:hypothetical protein